MSQRPLGGRLGRRSIAGLAAAVLSLAVLVAGALPAIGATNGPSFLTGPAGANGWFTGPVTGSVSFVAQPSLHDPRRDGDYDELINQIACAGVSSGGQWTGMSPQPGVSFTVTGDAPARPVHCVATYSRFAYAGCLGLFGCSQKGPWQVAGQVTWDAVVRVDSTPPINLRAQVPPPNAAGWYRRPAAGSFLAEDPVSGIWSCDPIAIGGPDGVGKVVTGGCRNNAGLRTNGGFGYKYDATAPVLQPVVTPSTVVLGSPATVDANASDATSGLATVGCGALDTTTPGPHTVTCTATDKAGNSASASAAYTVGYAFAGFRPPVRNDRVNTVHAPRAVPLRFRVSDASGAGVTTLRSVTLASQAASCSTWATTGRATERTVGGPGLRSLGDGWYQVNWKTSKAYARSCRVLSLDLGDGVEHTARFRFR